MDDVLPPQRRRHGRSATTIVDLRSIRRSDSYPAYNVRPEHRTQIWGAELAADTPGASSSTARVAASKIMSSMRRSFSTPRKRDASPMDRGMYSTPVESSPPIQARYSVQDAPRPTVQQIAMGLHVSRTPHLHPSLSPQPPHPHTRHRENSDETHQSHRSSSPSKPLTAGVDTQRRRGSASAMMLLPPPPKRSSLKKPGTPTTPLSAASSAPFTPTASDLSLTGSTLTSSVPPPPRYNWNTSVNLLPARLQQSMSRLLRVPSRKTSMASPTMSTSSNSDGDSESVQLTRRKMVRFSSSPVVNGPEAVS